MAAPKNPANSRVAVSTTEAGTYTSIGYVRSIDFTRGSEGDSTIYWLGGDDSTAGDKTLTGTLPVWWDNEDTDGQEILKAAYDAGTDVWLQVGPDGLDTGDEVMQFSAKITEISTSIDAQGDAVEGSFSFRGAPSTYTEVTLA